MRYRSILHQIMSDLQRPLIAAANVLHERVDLMRAHQLDRQMFCSSAFEHGTKRIDMADVGGDQVLDAAFHCEAAEVARTGVREGANLGLPAMLDKGFRECAFVDEQVRVAREPRDALARRRIAAEGHDLAFGLDAQTEAWRNFGRYVIDAVRNHSDVAVVEDDAGLIFRDLGTHGFDVGLPQRITGARANVGIECAALEQVARERQRTPGTADIERAGPAEDPARDHEERKLADVIMVQMGEKQMRDVGRIHVDAHHLPCRAVPAIEQELPAVAKREQDRGVAAVRIGQRGPGSKHDDTHRFALSQEFRNDCCGLVGAGHEKQMAVVDGHEARIRNEARQDAAVGNRHDRIVGSRHHQRRLRKEGKPGQAAPAEAGDELQVVAVVARPADMAKMLAHQLGRAAQCASIDVAGDLASYSRDPCSVAASPF